MPSWLDPETIMHTLGPFTLLGLCLIVFAECGLLIGFILPGDPLLFTAGLFTASGRIDVPLWLVCALLSVSAVVGNICGYWIGAKAGPALYNKPDSKLFKRQHLARTQEFFDRHGPRAIILARFIPLARTGITTVAGVARMEPKKYLIYSAIGGVLWAAGVTLLGAFLGRIPFVRDNVETMLIVIALVLAVPPVVKILQARRRKKLAENLVGGSEEVPTGSD
ncbi:DedA family protein [Nonomuraea purpurea]|uniref:DedA family protein n=1 Tax=Nonomuraea purpurea TaxID=1849276 RepID=A0ABV8GK60_9ACTN